MRSTARPCTHVPAQLLESRQLLTVTGFDLTDSYAVEGGAIPRFSWHASEVSEQTTWELWVDQYVTDHMRNSRVLYEVGLRLPMDRSTNESTVSYVPDTPLPNGSFVAWIRSHDPSGSGRWRSTDFMIAGESFEETLTRPETPVISVIREGRGYANHKPSEGRIGWTSTELLHDIWLNRRTNDGTWEVYRRIRNVNRQSISYRELQSAPDGNGHSFAGQQPEEAAESLPAGDYRIFIRSINAAVDVQGTWIGRSSWSSGFTFHIAELKGEAARPQTLTIENALRPTVEWSPVADAQYYLVSLWQGPDYSNNRQTIFRTHDTFLRIVGTHFLAGDQLIELHPGDEYFLKVRAVGPAGSTAGFAQGSFASGTVRVPHRNSVLPDMIEARQPVGRPAQPLLTWQQEANAETYDVWLSSLDSNRRMVLAENIGRESLRLDSAFLEAASDDLTVDVSAGLPAGRYRYWVRAHSSVYHSAADWSRPVDFEVPASRDWSAAISDVLSAAETPLPASNLAVPFRQDDRQFVLMTNGKGESFGASVLARFELDRNEQLVRPTVPGDGNDPSLEYPDLSVGTNVADIRFLPDGRLVILSRGSGELRLVDPVTWSIVNVVSVVSPSWNAAPDAIGMDVLPNGQIAIVYNRWNRLKLFELTDDGQGLQEIAYHDSVDPSGFVLPAGRGGQVSSFAIAGGAIRLFIATPGAHGTAVYDYQPQTGQLESVRDSSVISRSPFSNPFHGGLIGEVAIAGQSQTDKLYLSADRSGFLTWVDVVTLDHGFLDLASFMPAVSRSARQDNFANPNDNSFDSTRILGLGHSSFVVFNNRQDSVLIRLERESSGTVRIRESHVLPSGYAGTLISQADSDLLITTGLAPFSPAQQPHSIHVTQLQRTNENGSQTWQPQISVPQQMANPIVRAEPFANGLILQQADGSLGYIRKPTEQHADTILQFSNLISDDRGNRFHLSPGVLAAHLDKREFFVVGQPSDESHSGHNLQLLVLQLSDERSVRIVRSIPLPEFFRVHKIVASESQLVVLDRRGGQVLVVDQWDSDNPQHHVTELGQVRDSGLGRTRPGHAVIMPDQNVVLVHDTVPDLGISVITGSRHDNVFSVFHPNTSGAFSFDGHAFDSDRLISVSYTGHLTVQNLRTGVYEIDVPLGRFFPELTDIAAVESTSFHNGRLVIHSPATSTVAVLQANVDLSGQMTLQPVALHKRTDVVTTIATQDGWWMIGTRSVTFVYA